MPPKRDQYNYKKSFAPKGKKNINKYFKGKQGKTDEIKKSLAHRARLRKTYFKMLEKEGIDTSKPVPALETGDDNREKDKDDEEQADRPKTYNRFERSTEQRKPLTFQDRVKINQERKQRLRQEKIERTKQTLSEIKTKRSQRAERSKRIKEAKTSKGQPLMGPRINDLLDKIQGNR
ncbi:unnamed protein product [Ambrosiozyma monospora]|uniref:rRNA-processing protein FYV7 n=1 Tax=Ambrosiozyma monospora TaxID=43982 RepID=A0A9W6Z9C7_AMBMO|nr:unnamed protein product [Ambrosiozyma monospora]